MKKLFFFLAVGAIGFTACTSEDLVEEGVQTNAIGFSETIAKASRALTNESLTQFNVFGYYTKEGFTADPVTVFNNVAVKKAAGAEGEAASWKYENLRYWVPEVTYKFYAYSCENIGVSSANGSAVMYTPTSGNETPYLRINNYVCNNGHQHDLVYASNDAGIVGKAEGNQPVPFKFSHVLTKLDVEFESAFPAGYEIKISNVSVRGMYDKGNYNPKASGAVWYTTSGKLDYASSAEGYESFVNLPLVDASKNICAVANGDEEAKTVTTQTGYVLPWLYGENDNSVTLQFTVEITKNDVVDGEVTKIPVTTSVLGGQWSPQWKVGNYYTYHVSISGSEAGLEPIVFTTAADMNLDDWTTGSTEDVDMDFGL